MTVSVPMQPALPAITAILGGRPVSASTWMAASQLVNHLLGRGACVIPAFHPGLAAGIVAGTTRDFRFRTVLQAQTVALTWEVQLRSLAGLGAASAIVAITTPTSGSSVSYTVPAGSALTLPHTIRHVEQRTSQSASEVEINIRLAPTVNDVEVLSISCWAIPRAALDRTSTEYGIDQATQGPRQDIFVDPSSGGRSLNALMLDAVIASTTARRIGLLHLGLPDASGDAFQVTGAMGALYAGGGPILTRKIGRAATTGTVSCRVLAWASVGGTTWGTLQIDTTSGGVGTATIPLGSAGAKLTTTPTWYPLVADAAKTFSVDCEDLTEPDGLPGSTFDDVSFQASLDGAAATIYIATISCWEA